ncbi:hypothetical protein MESS2_980008 [Mesorhizobium metallidurans STM 2683]|uniref:Uncharacterized protein n=1 Tax=Mesorhizobium metallidurans STM 2683 TaxID=1297569 RepID=M5FBL0_9HYPH|nr:hypothetical protein MESS2_980008 [Mesorhizobium metallidurans STM 2683]
MCAPPLRRGARTSDDPEADLLCSVRLLFLMLKVTPAYKRTRQLPDAVVSVLSREL